MKFFSDLGYELITKERNWPQIKFILFSLYTKHDQLVRTCLLFDFCFCNECNVCNVHLNLEAGTILKQDKNIYSFFFHRTDFHYLQQQLSRSSSKELKKQASLHEIPKC